MITEFSPQNNFATFLKRFYSASVLSVFKDLGFKYRSVCPYLQYLRRRRMAKGRLGDAQNSVLVKAATFYTSKMRMKWNQCI